MAAAVALGGGGWRPRLGELKLVITADEEVGGGLGAHWLCEQHPDKVRSDFVVNEGGGELVHVVGGRVVDDRDLGHAELPAVRRRTERQLNAQLSSSRVVAPRRACHRRIGHVLPGSGAA